MMAGLMIAVTGASGFVGTNLLRRLSASGRPFRALIRSPAKAEQRGLALENLHVGDLHGDLEPLFEGATAVVHLAGLLHAVRRGDMHRVNAEGTERVVASLARAAPSARLVHVSTIAAAGPSSDGSSTRRPPPRAQPVSDYGRSKLAAEHAVARSDNDWLVLRPAIVYGPWDTDVLVMFKMLGRAGVPLVGPALRYSLVHVSDLCEAILRAVDSTATGDFVPIAHPRAVTQREWLETIAAALGKRPRFLRLPKVAAMFAAGGSEAWGRVRREAPVFGWDKYREMRAGSWVADTTPARELLGFQAAVDHLDGFRSTAAWYREHGWLQE